MEAFIPGATAGFFGLLSYTAGQPALRLRKLGPDASSGVETGLYLQGALALALAVRAVALLIEAAMTSGGAPPPPQTCSLHIVAKSGDGSGVAALCVLAECGPTLAFISAHALLVPFFAQLATSIGGRGLVPWLHLRPRPTCVHGAARTVEGRAKAARVCAFPDLPDPSAQLLGSRTQGAGSHSL
jgi:hypothetical protein